MSSLLFAHAVSAQYLEPCKDKSSISSGWEKLLLDLFPNMQGIWQPVYFFYGLPEPDKMQNLFKQWLENLQYHKAIILNVFWVQVRDNSGHVNPYASPHITTSSRALRMLVPSFLAAAAFHFQNY